MTGLSPTVCNGSDPMFVIGLASLLAVLSAGQASTAGTARDTAAAQTPGGSTPPVTPGAAPAAPRQRMVCTTTEVTGTRFPVRRCRTAAQAAAERTESQDQLRQAQFNRMPSSGN